MNIESIRDYCLTLPATSEYFPFDETTLAFRVADKIFAMSPQSIATRQFSTSSAPHYTQRAPGRQRTLTTGFSS